MSENRKISLVYVDPTGVTIDDPIELDYSNIGYSKPAFEGEEGDKLKYARYLLTVGEHQYLISRDGEIISKIY